MSPAKAPSPEFVLRGHLGEVQAVAFHSHMSLLYSGDSVGELIIWDLTQRRQLVRNRIHKPTIGVMCLRFLCFKESFYLLSQGRDGIIFVWAVGADGLLTRDPSRILEVGTYNFCRMDVLVQDHERALVAATSTDPAVVSIWNVFESRMLLQLIPKSDSNWGMCMALRLSEHCVSPANSARGVVCWAGYESGMVVLWSCDVKPSIMHEKQLQSEPIMAMCVAPDNLGGVCGGPEATFVIFSAAPDLLVTATVDFPNPGLADITMRHDGRIFVTAGWDGRMRVFRYMQPKSSPTEKGMKKGKSPGKLVAVLAYHQGGVNAVEFRRQDNLLASASKDKTVAVWRTFETTEFQVPEES